MSIQSIPIENKEPIDYNPIYKVNILVDDVIDSVYVFYGQKILQKNEEDIKSTIFTQSERENIKKIYFSEQQIHRDDTIGVIKLKILSELKKKVPLGEIYLFCKKFEYLNSIDIFQSLTQNKKIKLTRLRLEQFLSNIDNTNGDAFIMPEQKDEYDLNEMYKILEQQIVPMYYEQKDTWRQITQNGMKDVRFQFDSNRMADEYYEKMYKI